MYESATVIYSELITADVPVPIVIFRAIPHYISQGFISINLCR